MPLNVGDRLGHYDVTALIGEGGMGQAYAAHPDRLYLVGTDGRIAYAGGRGPWGFKPDELKAAMDEYLGRK